MKNYKRYLSVASATLMMIAATNAVACGNHLYMDPNQYGFFGRTAFKLAGLSAPEPVFKINHPSMAKVEIDEESQVVIEYDRPWRSDNVELTISSTAGITLPLKNIELDDLDGEVKLPFLLTKSGYNSITIKVTGEHKGKPVTSTSMVYVRAKQKSINKAKTEL
jgi:asparagine N-glycosylation enzyme membrane subunit Stt3